MDIPPNPRLAGDELSGGHDDEGTLPHQPVYESSSVSSGISDADLQIADRVDKPAEKDDEQPGYSARYEMRFFFSKGVPLGLSSILEWGVPPWPVNDQRAL